jgi:hypothetical protein
MRIKGRIDPHWSTWFEDLQVEHTDQGETILRGTVADQCALYGLLARPRDPGLQLLSVICEENRASAEWVEGAIGRCVIDATALRPMAALWAAWALDIASNRHTCCTSRGDSVIASCRRPWSKPGSLVLSWDLHLPNHGRAPCSIWSIPVPPNLTGPARDGIVSIVLPRQASRCGVRGECNECIHNL